MKKISKWITNHSVLILTIFLILFIPSIYGYVNTDINYDILSYLPSDIETIEGQNILTEKFGIGSFAFVFTNEKDNKTILNLENEMKQITGINEVISIANLSDFSIPIEMLPNEILDQFYKNEETLIFVTFKNGMSDEETLKGITKLRELTKEASVSGMSSMVLDTRTLSESEMLLYIIFAVLFCFLVLLFATDSYLVPLFLLGNIGVSILLNMGTNLFFGEIYLSRLFYNLVLLWIFLFSYIISMKVRKKKKRINSKLWN